MAEDVESSRQQQRNNEETERSVNIYTEYKAGAVREGLDDQRPARAVKKNNQAHKLWDHLIIILLLSLTVVTS